MMKNSNLSRTRTKLKSTRKPLNDVSNSKNTFKSDNISKKTPKENEPEVGNDSLDRLLLVHSDISSILKQVDELVVQAVQVSSKEGMLEIKLFADALSEMKNSVKPWVCRLQKVLSTQSEEPETKMKQPVERTNVLLPAENQNAVTESPEATKCESLISPSPLVSWRAGGNTQGGRQLFILTPLPQTKKHTFKCPASSIPSSYKTESEKNGEKESIMDSSRKFDDELSGSVVTKLLKDEGRGVELSKSVHHAYPETNRPMFLMTPCVKMSPPKSCILLEPVSLSKKKNQGARYRCTPFRVGGLKPIENEDSDSSSSQASDDLSLRYPELLGINLTSGLGSKPKVLDDPSPPDWMVSLSPPKTCAVLEPTDEPLSAIAASSCLLPENSAIHNKKSVSFSINENDCCQGVHASTMKLYHKPGLSDVVEITPMVKEPASIFRARNHPGENTLKKELWTMFEAASSHTIRFDSSSFQEPAPKEFLDLLNEACDS